MKNIKKIIAMLVIAFAFIANVTPICTKAEDNELEPLYIHVHYSEDITPKAGDIFRITYKPKHEEDASVESFEVDASTLVDADQELNLDENVYDITKLEYLGSNQEILDSCYGVSRSFTKGSISMDIILSIGEKELEDLRGLSSVVVTNEGIDYGNGEIESYAPDKYELGLEDTEEETESIEETTISTDANASAEEGSVITYETTKSSDSSDKKDVSYYLIKGIPVLIFLVVGVVTIIVLYKKKKI